MKDGIDRILYFYDRICPNCGGSLKRIVRKFRWKCENPTCDVSTVRFDTYGNRILGIDFKRKKVNWRQKVTSPPEEEIDWGS